MPGGNRYFRWILSGGLGLMYVRRLSENGSLFEARFTRTNDIARNLFDRYFPGVTPSLLPDEMRNNSPTVIEMIKHVADGDLPPSSSETAFDSESSIEGHLGVLHNRVAHGPGANDRILDAAFALRGPFTSFPNGIVLLSAEMGERYLQEDDKRTFLAANDSDISAFNRQVLDSSKPPDWSFAGNYIVLGNGSLVRCAHHEIVREPDGSVVNVLHLQTTSWHVFDGSFVWGYAFKPERPLSIDSVGLQAGKHAWVDLDTANVYGGVALFHHNNFAAPDVLTAREKGPCLTGDSRLIGDAHLRVMGLCLASLDRVSPFLQELRLKYGPPTTIAEIDNDAAKQIVESGDPARAESMEGLPVAHNTGVSFNGTDVLISAPVFGLPSGGRGTELVRTTLDTLLRYQMNESNWAAIRESVTEYIAARVAPDLHQKSRSELVDSLLGNPESYFDIVAIVSGHTLDNVTPQLESVIDELEVTDEEREDLSRRATDRFTVETVGPLLATGGPLRDAMDLHILEQQVAALDTKAVDEAVRDTAQKASSAARKAAKLKEEATTAHGSELQGIEEELEEQEKSEAELKEQADVLEAQNHDMENYETIRAEAGAHIENGVERFFTGED